MKITIGVKKIFMYLLLITYLKPYNISLVPQIDNIFKIIKVFTTVLLVLLFIKGKCKLSKISTIGMLFVLVWTLSIFINCGTIWENIQGILSIFGVSKEEQYK